MALVPGRFCKPSCVPGQPNHPTNRGPEQTSVEWDLIDVNGDGYPDFVFDSSPVDWYASPPSQHGAPNTDTGIVGEWVEFGPQQQNNQWAVNGRQPCNKAPQDCANANDIKVAYNVAGIRFDVDQNVFSNYVSLSAPGTNMGVAQWSCTGPCQYFYGGQPYTPQYQFSGFADVNGDGLVDRIVGNTAYLGTGAAFSNAFITLPGPMALTINDEPQVCKSGQQGKPTSHQLNGLRDLSGDGLPDYYDTLAPTVDGPSAPAVWIGTGTGFVGPVPIKSSQIGFRWSDQTETCDGSASSTDDGLFDIDGDGRPDVLTIGSTKNGTENGTVFWVSQLVGVDGQDPGRPEAGRLTRFDNGYGAVTQLSYTSAKQHTDNALAFPENVVTGVTVTGADHLGGTLAGSRFAYGNGSLVFDSALDRFVFPGYGRSAELQLFDAVHPIIGSGRAVGLALVTDRFGLTPFDPALSQHDRWVREKRVGQVSQTLTIHDITTTDPWGLLDTPALAQFVTSATEVARDANYYEAPAPANWNALDCFDMFLPYDYALSLSYNGTLSGGIDACRAHGFAYPTVITTWRGDSSPPSDQNVQTATRVLSIDDYGQPLELQLSNDVFRSDDDLCVDNVHATSPSGTLPRVVHALASRRIGTVCGSSVKNVPLAYDTWNYDNLPSGAVSTGLVTSHSLERHATDSGELLGTVRVFDATYDGLGNISTVTTTRGAASRTTTFTFDPFGLVPTQTRIDATGVPSRLVTTTYDPLSLQAASSTDINGTVRGLDFDGFDRPVRSTLTPAGGSLGIVSTTSYLGFDGADPAGRRLSGTGFTDPVDPAQISTAVGQTAVTYLDELGRERRTEVSLGGDYADQTLVVGARTYDGVGRVSFEADAYPKSVNLLSAYGTSYFYTQNDDLNCLIRGTGPQELTDISDLATERFPTCLIHRFASNTEIFEVRDASSLLANSPQAGVVQRTVQTAIGRTIERSTVSSAGVRLEAATYSYDHLGQPTSILRYLDLRMSRSRPRGRDVLIPWVSSSNTTSLPPRGASLSTAIGESLPRFDGSLARSRTSCSGILTH